VTKNLKGGIVIGTRNSILLRYSGGGGFAIVIN